MSGSAIDALPYIDKQVEDPGKLTPAHPRS